MIRFIHGYDENFFPGLVKNGLLNKSSGLKVSQHFATPENEKFNIIAAKGGNLHNLVKENSYLFYIDRLQGGTFYSRYDFDHVLLREYKEMLGEWFLGIQMHEWGAVLNYDWMRIRKQLADTPPPWTEQQIHDAVQKVSACKWCIHLSCGTAKEYSQKKYSETWQEYLEEMEQLFTLRQTENDSLLLPCDSNVMATAMEYRLGARTAMTEVGAQTPLTRLQVAIARGMSNALERHWGAYYEPWGGRPFSSCHFHEGKVNEWRLDNSIFPFDFTSHGPNGGSSRSLQRRIYYYALMSGAHYFGEEWGVNNTFSNWRDYPLTAYGEIKKDFIDFTGSYPSSKPFVPFAIVLPREFEAVDLGYINDPDSDNYLGRALEGEYKVSFDHIRKVLRLVYAGSGKSLGNEGYVITNSRFGDFFDVIIEDAGDAVFSKYEYLVDASFDSGFTKSGPAGKFRIFESADLDVLEHALGKIIESSFPCNVSGGIHWLLNRSGEKWVLSMFNNDGVDRSCENGDSLIPEAEIRAIIKFQKEPDGIQIVKCFPAGQTLQRKTNLTYQCVIPPGGFLILEF